MSNEKTMSIHRGLTELKTLEDRIQKATNDVCLVLAKRKSEKEIKGKAVDEVKVDMRASHDKVVDLINYRNAIKSAIILSNANTEVEVAGVKMTVAEAIDQKDAIEHKRNLYRSIKGQVFRQVSIYENAKQAFPAELEKYLVNILGAREKASKEDVELHTRTFTERNEYELLDPMNYVEVMDELEKSINDFASEVDAVLSESNAITQITVTV